MRAHPTDGRPAPPPRRGAPGVPRLVRLEAALAGAVRAHVRGTLRPVCTSSRASTREREAHLGHRRGRAFRAAHGLLGRGVLPGRRPPASLALHCGRHGFLQAQARMTCRLECTTARHFAQCISVCRWLQSVYAGRCLLPEDAPLCTRLARERWRDTSRLSQCLRATNCYQLRVISHEHVRSPPASERLLPAPAPGLPRPPHAPRGGGTSTGRCNRH